MKKILFWALILMIAAHFVSKYAVETNSDTMSYKKLEKQHEQLIDKALGKKVAIIHNKLILIPYEVLADAIEWIDVPTDSTEEEGWALLGLTKEGKQLNMINIPETIEGKPITAISTCAIFGCTALTSVTVPDTIHKVAESAFLNCPKLRSITSTGDFFDAVGGVNSPIFADCNISEWNYSDGLDMEFSFAPMAE